jgi:sugar O-acyltransferase (sialic acid O-acetyltransferase NeuD family)
VKIVIIGAGGFGREVLSLIKNINIAKHTFEVLGFLDDGLERGMSIHDKEVVGGVKDFTRSGAEGAILAVGKSNTREQIKSVLPDHTDYPNIIHPNVIFQDEARINLGYGNIICAGNIFTTDIKIGNFNIFNLSSTIGHDVQVSDFCSIMPGVNISGGAKLHHGVYVGTGAKLIKATDLGSYCTVGAGAVVDADVKANSTVVGVPARPINKK